MTSATSTYTSGDIGAGVEAREEGGYGAPPPNSRSAPRAEDVQLPDTIGVYAPLVVQVLVGARLPIALGAADRPHIGIVVRRVPGGVVWEVEVRKIVRSLCRLLSPRVASYCR